MNLHSVHLRCIISEFQIKCNIWIPDVPYWVWGDKHMLFHHIRALREDKDVSQKTLGELLGMAQNTYSQYENGKIAWTAELLIKLSDYYHVSIDYLLDRTNDPTPYPPPRR